MLQAGADGYLTKNHSPTALAEELAVSLSEGRALSPHEALSNREYEVFRRLGAGIRVNEIAQELALSPRRCARIGRGSSRR